MKRLSALGLAALACLASPAALANPTASASLSNLHFLIFDLTPADGITPTFTITSPLVNGTYANSWLETGQTDYQSSALSLSSSVASALASAGATLVGGAALGDFVFTSTSSSSGSVVANQSDAGAYSYLNFNVQFSTNALLVLVGDAVASASGAQAAGASASASSFVQLADSAGNTYGYGNVSAYAYTSVPSDSAAGTASASMLNTSGSDLSVWAYGEAYSNVTAAPIPEPGSYPMLLAGLLAVGAVVRRRS